jgi:putative ATP-dependent endonuclease of the OLD family
VLVAINTEIKTALDSLTGGVRRQEAKVNFGNESLLDVARDLRFKLGDANLALEDIRASGLGYANLLYMSTIIVELAKAKDSDLTLFLVEEPEAHLHPQLQMLVLEFLLEQARASARRALVAGQPEGRVQVVVTTHSPNLTAWVSPKHIVVVKSQRSADPAGLRSKTVAVPVAELPIRPKTLAKIERYLDVTRSALLFGNKAILVEGLAEAILLPVIARHLVLNHDREAWLRFKGNVIASIEGVDFRPYVEVLLSAHDGSRIADRVVVITDADPTVRGNRKADLEALATGHGAQACLGVYINEHTLEHELFLAGNETFLKNAFLKLHRGSRQDWVTDIEAVAPELRPAAFLALIAKKKTRKGDFAQEVASRIAAGQPLLVPDYLADAVRKSAEA